MHMYEHAMSYNPDYAYGEVKKIDNIENNVKTVLIDEQEYFTKNIIVATGTIERKIGAAGQKACLCVFV